MDHVAKYEIIMKLMDIIKHKSKIKITLFGIY